MTQRTFEAVAHTHATPTDVIDYLVDLRSQRVENPYVESASLVAEAETAQGWWSQWNVIQRTPLSPLPYLTVTTMVTRVSSGHVRVEHLPVLGCSVRSEITAATASAGSLVREITTVRAPSLSVHLFAAHIERTHRRSLAESAAALRRPFAMRNVRTTAPIDLRPSSADAAV